MFLYVFTENFPAAALNEKKKDWKRGWEQDGLAAELGHRVQVVVWKIVSMESGNGGFDFFVVYQCLEIFLWSCLKTYKTLL